MALPNPTATNAWLDFYRPHDRAATWYTGELVNHITGEIYKPPSRTKQSFLAQCDINNIIKGFQTTGMINHINAQAAQGMYADLPDEVDFQQSLETVKRGEEAFASLPSKVRARFENNPLAFMAFLADPANRDEAISLGLIDKPVIPPTPPTPSPAPENGSQDPTS